MKINALRFMCLSVLMLLGTNYLNADTMYYEYPQRRHIIKPYMDLDFSENLRPDVAAPFEYRSKAPGVALNLGFRF